jgi:hypothetical protein
MAETKRMTAEQVVGYLLEGEGLDFLRESLSWIVAAADGGGGVGADRRRARRAGAGGAVHAPQRLPQSCLADARRRDRAGDPEDPPLQLLPSFLEPRKRSEQALVAVVQEAYVVGVSTRKVDQLVESLGLRNLEERGLTHLAR